ncbi:hypothetical protein GH714_020175 [Hevea brasiliensis]|uniref:Cell wall hydroxyproline-rich glycoprotein n=1 Tax=Hevea brasiliensis TaxID=3981 RepID=A0A6A6K6Y4_HEVBR|nr:hypothetical protein GH714_020175 [Hevea brasiliensis]
MRNPYLTLTLCGILIFLSKLSHQASYFLPSPIHNPRLVDAFVAFQAWKHSITSDPNNFTLDWCSPNVCNYTGVYCAPAPDDNRTITVAGIDLNRANISGSLPEELGLLTDLALFHLNSNRFCGSIPDSFRHLRLLYELDISNNQFSGEFPSVVLHLPSLKFLDIRFNEFHGNVPPKLFDLQLDALFINNNKFNSSLPENFGNSPVSVVVLANNNISGCIPSSLTKMAGNLTQIILMNMGLTGCLQSDIGLLNQVKVFDVSFNNLVGSLPDSMGEMKSEPPVCLKLSANDDRENCIHDRPLQRSPEECEAFYANPVKCDAFGCSASPPLHPHPQLLRLHQCILNSILDQHRDLY